MRGGWQVDETALAATVSELIATPSMGGTPAEAEIQHLLAERLTALGLSVDLWPIDLADLRSRPDFPGEEVDRTQAWGLVGTHRPDERPEFVLQGHVDVPTKATRPSTPTCRSTRPWPR